MGSLLLRRRLGNRAEKYLQAWEMWASQLFLLFALVLSFKNLIELSLSIKPTFKYSDAVVKERTYKLREEAF